MIRLLRTSILADARFGHGLGILLFSLLTSASCSSYPFLEPDAASKIVPGPFGFVPAKSIDQATFQSGTILFRRANIMTATGPTIMGGSLLIRDGRILSVTPGDMQAPKGALVLDANERYITPGLIDTHSHMGVYPIPGLRGNSDGNEASDPNTAHVRAEDALWPQDPSLERALQGGVTTVQVLPGSANLIGGTGVTIKVRPARTSSAMRFSGAPRGLKMACGENPKRVYGRKGRAPKTRMGNFALRREYFNKAKKRLAKLRAYRKSVAAYNRGGRLFPPTKPAPDNKLDVLAAALAGEILIHVHCYRADEMARMLELAHEFKFKIRSFHHAVEAYKIRDLLAREKVAASVWADWWGFKIEAGDGIIYNAALLAEAGSRAIIHSDSESDVQRLNQEAARAFFAGRHEGIQVSELEALRWITANPAWALGIDGQVGTIEKGKRADIVLWDGHPFSVYTKTNQVYSDGVLLYDSAQPRRPWSDFEAGLAQ